MRVSGGVGGGTIAATTSAAGRALDLVVEERQEETLLITPVEPRFVDLNELGDQSRVDEARWETSDEKYASWAFGNMVRNESTRGLHTGVVECKKVIVCGGSS